MGAEVKKETRGGKLERRITCDSRNAAREVAEATIENMELSQEVAEIVARGEELIKKTGGQNE